VNSQIIFFFSASVLMPLFVSFLVSQSLIKETLVRRVVLPLPQV